MSDIDRDELDHHLTVGPGGSWRWEFPNGHHVSVIPDPRRTLRFEVLSSAAEGTDPITPGLTTEQVEANLVEVYTLPAQPKPVMAWVSVDGHGRIADDSTVTVDGEIWPVPERSESGWRMAPARIGEALRQRGWRQIRDAKDDRSEPRFVGIPVERINEE